MNTFIVDVDGTIALPLDDIETLDDYNYSVPNEPVIEKINELYNQGHRIIIYTARGNTLCKNPDKEARPDLESWLNDNGVMYHELHFGKISFPDTKTYYVGDENLTIDQFINKNSFEEVQQENCGIKEKNVLILGNGISRTYLKEKINNWAGEIWVCNYAFKEILDLGTKVTKVATVHKEMITKAKSFRTEHNLSFSIITKPIFSNVGEDEHFSDTRGWSTGSLCIVEAFKQNYDKIFLAGFDMGGQDIYQSKILPGANFENQYKTIIKEYDESKVFFMEAPEKINSNVPLLRTQVIEQDGKAQIKSLEVDWPVVPEDRVLIIANGVSALDAKLGEEIDKFPYVVRMNDFVTEGYESFVGSKTDLWMSACSPHTRIKGRQLPFSIGLLHKKTRERSASEMYNRTGCGLDYFHYLPDKVFEKIHKYFGENAHSVSTGLRTIILFQEILKIPNVYVYGFDFYERGNHYYKEKIEKYIGKGHNWQKERAFYLNLLREGKIKDFSGLNYSINLDKDLPIKNIVLFGNSGYLKDLDVEEFSSLKKSKDITTGGINRIYKLLQPDYYFFMDGDILKELRANSIVKQNDSTWLIPSYIYSNPEMPLTKQEMADYVNSQQILEITDFNFQKYTKRKSSLIWLITYLQNEIYKNYKCKFYLYGVSLMTNKTENYFFNNALLEKPIICSTLQNQYDSQYHGYRTLIEEGYNLISLTPNSRLNTIMPFIDMPLIDFITGMPDK